MSADIAVPSLIVYVICAAAFAAALWEEAITKPLGHTMTPWGLFSVSAIWPVTLLYLVTRFLARQVL